MLRVRKRERSGLSMLLVAPGVVVFGDLEGDLRHCTSHDGVGLCVERVMGWA